MTGKLLQPSAYPALGDHPLYQVGYLAPLDLTAGPAVQGDPGHVPLPIDVKESRCPTLPTEQPTHKAREIRLNVL